MIMGTITIKSSLTNTTADYTNETKNIVMNLNYGSDKETGQLLNISGAVMDTTTDPATYIGNFNGTVDRDGEMHYNFSAIKDLSKLSDIADCLTDICSQIEPKE